VETTKRIQKINIGQKVRSKTLFPFKGVMEKTIYMFWAQGFKNAPTVVQACLSSWKKHNPRWTIVQLDDTTLPEYIDIHQYIPDIDSKKISKPAFSDIVRIFLLHKFGGVWCDATVFCNESLDIWLAKYTETGFFAFNKPGKDRLLSSWFLYSKRGNYITTCWFHETVKYWNTHEKKHTYFWFHYLFGALYQNNEKIKTMWNKTNKIPAKGPHYFVPYHKKLFQTLTDDRKEKIMKHNMPLYKLTHKYNKTKYNDTCVLSYFIG
jgi:hypothetical protein